MSLFVFLHSFLFNYFCFVQFGISEIFAYFRKLSETEADQNGLLGNFHTSNQGITLIKFLNPGIKTAIGSSILKERELAYKRLIIIDK